MCESGHGAADKELCMGYQIKHGRDGWELWLEGRSGPSATLSGDDIDWHPQDVPLAQARDFEEGLDALKKLSAPPKRAARRL